MSSVITNMIQFERIYLQATYQHNQYRQSADTLEISAALYLFLDRQGIQTLLPHLLVAFLTHFYVLAFLVR